MRACRCASSIGMAVSGAALVISEEVDVPAGDVDVVQPRPRDADLEPRDGGDHHAQFAVRLVTREGVRLGESHYGHRRVHLGLAAPPLVQRQLRRHVGPDVRPAAVVAHLDEDAPVLHGRAPARVLGGEGEEETRRVAREVVARVGDGEAEARRAQHHGDDGDDRRRDEGCREGSQDEVLGFQAA